MTPDNPTRAAADEVETPGAASRYHGLGLGLGHDLHRGLGRDLGMATAEYAVATLAAVGFAGLLLTILRGNEVRGLLLDLVRRALAVG